MLDVKNMSTDEIANYDFSLLSKSDLENVTRQLQTEASIFKTKEQANKLVLNSIYGAMANRFFYFYDKDLAEAITIQGQDAIRYSQKIVNYYFNNLFHKDKKLIEELQKIDNSININPEPVKKPAVIYIDTDSCYITYEEVAEKLNWTGDVNQLVLTIDEFRLKPYLSAAFNKYAGKFNTDNYLDFELETISRNGIWAQKKKYIQDISWSDGKIYDENNYIKTTGLEIIRANIPSFCRKELMELVKWVFKKGKNFTQRDITIELINLKKRFSIADIEDITFNTGIGDYEKYVKDDINSINVADGCGAHIRGAAIYNNILNNNVDIAKQYEKLKTGDKVKWYYVKTIDEKYNVFSFKRGNFPKDFAPEIDLDVMFEKSIINPLNNIIGSIEGVDPISGSLQIKRKLF